MKKQTAVKQSRSMGGFLGWVERIGNRIPHPLVLFLFLMGVVALISFIAQGAKTVNPSTGKEVVIKNILSGAGFSFILKDMVKNFISFPPMGLVLSMTLGIGLAEEVGLMSAFMRKTILGVPAKFVVPAIMIVGICGNLASDAAVIVVPTLSAMIFLYLGRNPIAGIALGYAATTAGFSANLVIAGTDALLQGITNSAADLVGAPHIDTTANWFIMIASTFVLTIVGTLVNNYIIEPRLGNYEPSHPVEINRVSSEESRGLRFAGIALLVYVALIVVICIPQNSFMRNPQTGSLTNKSTLLGGIIPLILLMFIITGVAYGKGSGVIQDSWKEVSKIMERAVAKMSSFIVLAFVIGQFIAWFNWTNLGFYMAIKLANALKSSGMVGIPLFIFYILIVAFINLFIGSGSSKWALLAPIFVPMMYMLGYHPAWTQFLYRVGDSATNILSPIFPYFLIILNLMEEYDENSGTGTLISLMIPYSFAMLAVWIIFTIVWYLFIPIPIGIGGQIFA